MTYNPDTNTALSPDQLFDIGALALTDIDVVHRNGVDYKAPNASRLALFRKTPAGTRSVALPATLTATDHDKNIFLTGSAGVLSADGTITDGFRCHIINGSTGAATYAGIVGLLGTTSLASGAVTTVLMAGATIYATAALGTTTTVATAYTIVLSAPSGSLNSPVTVSYVPTAGVWPTGEVITLSKASGTGTGTLAVTTLSAPANSAAPLSTTLTMSAAGTYVVHSSTSPSMTDTTGDVTFTASAATATGYSMTESATVGLVGAPVTLTFAPAGGAWPGSTTITPAAANVAGTFSPTTVSPTGTSQATITFTPSAAGTATFSATNNQSLQNPTNLFYVANATATAYTQALSSSTGGAGSPVRFTVTPTGGWPAGVTVTPSVSPNIGTLSPSSITPQTGSTAGIVFTYTPISAGAFSLNTSTSPALTNTSGAQTYTVAASTAGAYTMVLDAPSGAAGSPVTITLAPNPSSSVWPAGESFSLTASPTTGSFSFGSLSPSQGTTTPLTGTFTPSAAGAYTISSSVSPTMTNSSGAQSYTATGNAPSYPTITTSGVSRLLIIDGNAGIVTSNGLITTANDQSGNNNDLTATAGVTVGPAVNGFNGIAFGGVGAANNSGLRSTGSWLSNMAGDATFAFAIRTGASLPTGECIFNFEPTTYNSTDDIYCEIFPPPNIAFWKRRVGRAALGAYIVPSATANTIYKIVVRLVSATGHLDWAVNGGSINSTVGGVMSGATYTNFAIGQGATVTAANSIPLHGATATSTELLEFHATNGALSDSDVASYQSYLTSKWGS